MVLCLLAASCSTRMNGDKTIITGKVRGYEAGWIYLEELEVKGVMMIDSVKTDKEGNFTISFTLDQPGFYVLRAEKENRITLLLEKNERVQINCNSEIINNSGCTISGSPGSELLARFESFMAEQKSNVDSLYKIYLSSEGSPDFLIKKAELDSAYAEIVHRQKEYVTGFINHHPGSLASLLLLNRKFGNSKVLDEEEDFIYFHRIDSALMINYPDNKNTIDHHRRVEEIRGRMFDRFNAEKKLKPGENAPNIVVSDTSDRLVGLKSLEGKNVLLCFWAGWNAKSRQDNRKLVEVYPGFRKKNLEVFGVSLDENEVIWKSAVRLDKLPGIQGSDLKGLNSDVMKDYQLYDRLPNYYLIGTDQKIIYRDRDFDKIKAQIEKLL